MRKVIAPDRQESSDNASANGYVRLLRPCDFPGRKEFSEIELNPEQQRQLLQALEEVLRETGIPETNQQELLSKSQILKSF